MERKKRIVVLGGGTGSYTVLSGLKKYPVSLTAVVSMADDGGSTGQLRDELGVLPPGDVRQCLVALSASDRLMRALISYRFTNGGLKGHSFGNILLSALEKTTGSFDKAVEKASEILRLEGSVLPATLEKTRLIAHTPKRVYKGEKEVTDADLRGLTKLCLRPKAKANPKALRAIKEADLVVIGPGNFFCSLLPVLLIDGIAEAVCQSRATKVYLCNLMTVKKQTEGWGVRDFTSQIESYLGCEVDYVMYNKKTPTEMMVRTYAAKGERPVAVAEKLETRKFRGADLISKKMEERQKGDAIKRSLVRHNSGKLARLLLGLLD